MNKFIKKFKLGIRWKEKIGMPYCPYMERWILNLGVCSFRLHHWFRSDDKRALHNHPWAFLTVVLKGGYTDVSPNKKEYLKRGNIRLRKSKHFHYVEVDKGGCWSFLITGPTINKKWGFRLDNGKFFRKDKYFKKYGHPACDEI